MKHTKIELSAGEMVAVMHNYVVMVKPNLAQCFHDAAMNLWKNFCYSFSIQEEEQLVNKISYYLLCSSE